MKHMNAKSIQEINFVKRNGLIPVIVQDRNTKDILMLAYANREALDCTYKNRKCLFLEYFS